MSNLDFRHYLTSGEAVEFLQQKLKQEVHYYDIDNLIRAGAIETPEMIAGRRMWSPDDLKAAAKALRIRRVKRPNLTNERSLINEEE